MIAHARQYGPLVVIETPTRASAPAWLDIFQPLGVMIDGWLNRRYAKLCERDALLRGEHPYTPPAALWDAATNTPALNKARERAARARAGYAWGAHGDVRAFYLDRGLCQHMRQALREVLSEPRSMHIEFRTLRPRRSWIPTQSELRIHAHDTPPL